MLHWKKEIDDVLIAVWKIDESIEKLLAMLDCKSNIANILSVKSDRIKSEKLAVRILFKYLLHREVDLKYNDAGRPFLIDDMQNISISHTKGYAAIAISSKCEIGLDIEYVSDKILRVRDRIISQQEYIDSDKVLVHSLLHWCAKESAFKVMDMDGVDYIDHLCVVPFDPQDEGILVIEESKSIQARRFNVYYRVESDFVLTCLKK